MIEVGDVVSLPWTVTDATTGLPADVGAATISVTLPDLAGTVQSSPAPLTIVRPTGIGTGLYRCDFTPTLPGPHPYAWVGTGTNATTYRDMFTVEDQVAPLVGIDEALAHLRAQAVITSYPDREYLRWLIKVASRAVEGDLRRVLARRTIVDTFDGGAASVVLRGVPLLAVTSVVDSGTTLTAGTEFTVDTRLGLLYRGTQTSLRSFRPGVQTLVVTYQAGYLQPPTIVRQVCLRGVQRLWQQSNQMPHPSLDDLDAEARLFVPSGVLTPVEMGDYKRLRLRRGIG